MTSADGPIAVAIRVPNSGRSALSVGSRPGLQEIVRFSVDYTLFLNVALGAAALALLWLHFSSEKA